MEETVCDAIVLLKWHRAQPREDTQGKSLAQYLEKHPCTQIRPPSKQVLQLLKKYQSNYIYSDPMYELTMQSLEERKQAIRLTSQPEPAAEPTLETMHETALVPELPDENPEVDDERMTVPVHMPRIGASKEKTFVEDVPLTMADKYVRLFAQLREEEKRRIGLRV